VVVSNGVTNVTDTVYDASMPVEEVGYAQGTNTPYVSAMYLIGPRGPEYRRDVVHQSVSWYVYDELESLETYLLAITDLIGMAAYMFGTFGALDACSY
jgi:hypothetical protein